MLQFSEGFDPYDDIADMTIRGTRTLTADVLDATAGPFGTQCRKVNDSSLNSWLWPLKNTINFGTNLIHAAFWFKIDDNYDPETRDIFILKDTVQNSAFHITLGPLGAIATGMFRSNASSVLETSASGVVQLDTWHHFECAYRGHDSLGSHKVWVDGALILDMSGIDNLYGGAHANAIDAVGIFSTGSIGFEYHDDVLVWDETGSDFDYAGPLGPHKIEILFPDGDSSVQFTPTGAGTTNADRVKETGTNDGDTTYVESSTVGHVDLYTLGDQAEEPPTTHGIAVHTIAKKTDSGAVTLHNRLQHNSQNFEGSDHALTTAYLVYSDYTGNNPDGGGQWASDDVDALLAGIEFQA